MEALLSLVIAIGMPAAVRAINARQRPGWSPTGLAAGFTVFAAPGLLWADKGWHSGQTEVAVAGTGYFLLWVLVGGYVVWRVYNSDPTTGLT